MRKTLGEAEEGGDSPRMGQKNWPNIACTAWRYMQSNIACEGMIDGKSTAVQNSWIRLQNYLKLFHYRVLEIFASGFRWYTIKHFRNISIHSETIRNLLKLDKNPTSALLFLLVHNKPLWYTLKQEKKTYKTLCNTNKTFSLSPCPSLISKNQEVTQTI